MNKQKVFKNLQKIKSIYHFCNIFIETPKL
jgi:hypothetical protein